MLYVSIEFSVLLGGKKKKNTLQHRYITNWSSVVLNHSLRLVPRTKLNMFYNTVYFASGCIRFSEAYHVFSEGHVHETLEAQFLRNITETERLIVK